MDASKIVKSTQEQAAASWVDYLNQLRLNELMAKLTQQDTNLEGALETLNNLKIFVSNPGTILGSELTKHGEIAEHAQVNISNARRIIEGLKSEYTFDGVGRLAPEDYLRNGTYIQAKFYNSAKNTLKAIEIHHNKYPDYIKNGGKYQIPKDYYSALEKYAGMSLEEGGKLTKEEGWRLYVAVQKFLDQSGVDLKDIEPTIVGYDDIQLNTVNKTIANEQNNIEDTDQSRRNQFHEESKPTLQEGLKATAASAAIEGGMSFCLNVAKKLKSGKKLNDFTEQDWKDVGIETAKGTGKGTIRGASIYTLTNFTATPAAVASALVTASFGMTSQAYLLRQGKITSEEFIENSEIVCLDVTVSAVASLMGQVIIPIPVLGAVIGNAVGMFMYGIAKDNLSRQEQTLILGFNENIQKLNEQLDVHYMNTIEQLQQEFAKFKSISELAFDLDVNVAFAGSVTLSQLVGCSEGKILKDKAAVDTFFLE